MKLSTVDSSGNVALFPKRRGSWKRLRVLFRRARAVNISTVGKPISILEDRSTSSTESIGEAALRKANERRVQKALVVESKGQYKIRHDFPMPHVGDEEVMIQSHFVGLNPIDWKSVDYNFCLPSFPWITGREMSGEVVQVGSSVKGICPGAKVWTSTYYRDVRAGCFQEYVVVPEHTVLPVPEGIPMEAAACFGVAAMTACMTLWKWLEVACPSTTTNVGSHGDQACEWILIWGGSTITGQFATQLAVLSGLKVITVNSEQTAALSRSLGAHYVVTRDGKTGDQMIDEIRSLTSGRITRAIDIVGHKTATLVLEAVSTELPVSFAPLAMMASEQQVPPNVTIQTVEMKQFILDPGSVRYALELNRLLKEGRIVLPSLQLLDGSFEDIIAGLETLKRGNMGGKKLVVKV